MRLRLLAAAIAVLASSLAAHADVIYSYVGNGHFVGTTFTIDSPDFLTKSYAFVPVTTSSDLFAGRDLGKLTAVQFFISGLTGVLANGQRTSIFLETYTINQDGLYTDVNGSTLNVSGSPTATPVTTTPEPSSLALLGTGLLGLAGAVRRRLA